MPDKEEKEPIFLNDGRILPWERPTPPGRLSMLAYYSGETKITGYNGYEEFNHELGNYHINANAAVYRANILPTPGAMRDIPPGQKAVDSLLFSGSLQIYKLGEIPGTQFKGLDFLVNRLIWTSVPYEELSRVKNPLTVIILGKESKSKAQLNRVERIIKGYEIQKEQKEESESRGRHDEYMRGAHDNHEAAYGTFSHVPFEL